MKEGPTIAAVASLLGDPARANMLTALMDGRALTARELAETAGVTPPTASGHLAKLVAAGLLADERQGRHRYFRLSGADVAQVLEGLMGLAQRTGAIRVRTGPKDTALRAARLCYDHLAGGRGVAMLEGMVRDGWLTDDAAPVVSAGGRRLLADFGIDLAPLEAGRRPLCRCCLDWSERRSHLGGALGAAMLRRMVALGWAQPGPGRVLAFTGPGGKAFEAMFEGTGKARGSAPGPSWGI